MNTKKLISSKTESEGAHLVKCATYFHSCEHLKIAEGTPGFAPVIVMGGDTSDTDEDILSSLPRDLDYFIAFSEEEVTYFDRIRALWQNYFNTTPPKCERLELPLIKIDFAEFALNALRERYVAALHQNVSLMRSLAELRVDYEGVMASFEAVESQISQGDVTRRIQRTMLAPISYNLDTQRSGMSSFEQTLPGHAAGLSDFAISIAALPDNPTGFLDVRISSIEDQSVIAAWTVKGSDLFIGWLRFSLDRCLPMRQQSLQISGEWHGEKGPKIALGVSHPSTRWQGVINGEVAGRTIALKTWTGLAGVALPRDSRSVRQAKSITRHSMLDLSTVAEILSSTDVPGFVFYNPDTSAIQVHPEGNLPTRACLPQSCPEGVTRISVAVETMHQEGGLVEYAFGVAPKSQRQGLRESSFTLLEQSDWLLIGPAMRGQLNLFVSQKTDEIMDLYFLTRVPPGRSTENCWANFSGVEFEHQAP